MIITITANFMLDSDLRNISFHSQKNPRVYIITLIYR